MKRKIEPTILRGTRDFLPYEMVRRNAVMGVVRDTFEQFGYAPLETPILSPAETILGKYGEEGDQLTYSFKDHGGRDIALPYDLTVPFARYVAAHYQELPMPFKRYQIQRVWRAERPQKGRLREFYQCDIDIIGSTNLLCEAEIVKVIDTVFKRLSLERVRIKCNSRRLLNSVLSDFDIPEDLAVSVLRIIDKLDKIGEEAVAAELTALGIVNAKTLLSTLAPAETNQATLQKLGNYDTAEIKTLLELSSKLSVSSDKLIIDPTLARGLDYYTGIVFEVVDTETDFGSLCGGGRYDNLCGLFSEQDFSGVGVAFGFERIMLLLEQKGYFAQESASSLALIAVFNGEAADAISIYDRLIADAIPAEIYLGKDKLAKQFRFADKKGIPLVVLQGPDERANDEVTVRWMNTGTQETVGVAKLTSYIRQNETALRSSQHHGHMPPASAD